MKQIDLLKDRDSPQCREFHSQLMDLYVDEFGMAWVLKEVAEARQEVRAAMIHNSGRIFLAVSWLFNHRDKMINQARAGYYIGTRSVTAGEFGVYVKGLYWLAGFSL